MKLRSHLIVLVLVALVPLLVFAGVMIALYDRQQRATGEKHMIDNIPVRHAVRLLLTWLDSYT